MEILETIELLTQVASLAGSQIRKLKRFEKLHLTQKESRIF